MLYPTETFYALGCLAASKNAIAKIYAIKQRPIAKKLPLLAADYEQANGYADCACAPYELMAQFWPGPLTLLLPARKKTLPILCNEQGKIAIRASAGEIAARLARACQSALICTSANLSGKAPAQTAATLDKELIGNLSRLDISWGIVRETYNRREDALPSTIIEPCLMADNKWLLCIHRTGAIDKSLLNNKNFSVVYK